MSEMESDTTVPQPTDVTPEFDITAPPTEAERKVFAVLDQHAVQGDGIPSIRAIRAEARVRNEVISGAIRKWEAARSQAEAQDILKTSTTILGKELLQQQEDSLKAVLHNFTLVIKTSYAKAIAELNSQHQKELASMHAAIAAADHKIAAAEDRAAQAREELGVLKNDLKNTIQEAANSNQKAAALIIENEKLQAQLDALQKAVNESALATENATLKAEVIKFSAENLELKNQLTLQSVSQQSASSVQTTSDSTEQAKDINTD